MFRKAIAVRRPTLRGQLLWRLVPPVLLVVFVSAYAAYTLGLRFANEAYDTALFDSARSLAQQIQIGEDRQPSLMLPRAAQEILVSDPYDRIFYRVIAADGATVAGNAPVPAPTVAPAEENPVSFYDAQIEGEPVRVGAYALLSTAGSPTATVLFAETLVKRTRLSRRLVLTLVLPLMVVTGIVGALVWFGVRLGLAPLNQLASALARRGWGDLRAVGHEGVPEEVRPLIESLDNLMKRLDAAHTAQQRFISQAAHQLRTPIAGLTTQVERALLASDIASIRPALTQLQSASRRVNRLVNQLLTLAKAEPGSDPQHDLARLDLSKLVQETCREWVPEALAKEVDLGFAGEASTVMVLGHELLLAEMLNNLIDNALRYAAHAGGSITVRLSANPYPEVTVEDDGPGIPEVERGRIFERFHRLPGSPAGGCGLGLAIVREIALLHGAEVHAEAQPSGQGIIFRIAFRPNPVGAVSGR
jgi:two-component system, OmpR family, sensor histidine kinase TctE